MPDDKKPDPKKPDDKKPDPAKEAEQPVRADGSAGPPGTPPAVAGFEAAGPVVWATDLVTELARTGTGADKLDVIRRAMVARHADPEHARKPAGHPSRHLTAAEAAAVLEADPAVPRLTAQKARSLADTGRYVPAAAVGAHPADILPPPPKG